jgi:hypothetical protein
VTTDWRGVSITVGTDVLFKRGHSGDSVWKIGAVTDISPADLLTIEWKEQSDRPHGQHKSTHGVSPMNVTVWPK